VREAITYIYIYQGPFGHRRHHPALRMSGAYILAEEEPIGFVKYMADDPSVEDHASSLNVIDIVRSWVADGEVSASDRPGRSCSEAS
jgi:hypothetical protein